jgi:pSer/pThr/pTyr-binding forkhead associated (FHA) protein
MTRVSDQSDDRRDETAEQDRTETIDPLAEARTLREREAAAGIPGLAGFALIVASGPRRGMHWSLPTGSTEAGRDPEAPIFLDDVTVSRHHAEFTVEEGTLNVRDLGSTNGTYVNGRRIDAGTLEPGDEVIIGRFHLVVARGA